MIVLSSVFFTEWLEIRSEFQLTGHRFSVFTKVSWNQFCTDQTYIIYFDKSADCDMYIYLGVRRGSWYFEAVIEEMPENAATRIGWAQQLGNILVRSCLTVKSDW